MGQRYGVQLARFPTRGSLEAELSLLIRGFHVDRVLDVGAHAGGFGHRLRKDVRFAGNIVSFEPDADTFKALQDAITGDQRWRALNIALGSENGEVILHRIGGSGQFNSIRGLGEFAATYSPDLAPSEGHPVSIRRLDSIWADLPDPESTTLLKTDTQGFDLEVIRGAEELMANLPVVVMEVAVQAIYDGAPLLDEIVREMSDRNFDMTGAFPVHRYGNGTRVIEFDCTFVNSSMS